MSVHHSFTCKNYANIAVCIEKKQSFVSNSLLRRNKNNIRLFFSNCYLFINSYPNT